MSPTAQVLGRMCCPPVSYPAIALFSTHRTLSIALPALAKAYLAPAAFPRLQQQVLRVGYYLL